MHRKKRLRFDYHHFIHNTSILLLPATQLLTRKVRVCRAGGVAGSPESRRWEEWADPLPDTVAPVAFGRVVEQPTRHRLGVLTQPW